MGLYEKIINKTAKIGIIGLGYVGLPNLIHFCKRGFNVVGIEKNLDKIKQIKAGTSYIEDVSSEDLAIYSEQYNITANPSAISEVDIVIIDVPTPINETKIPNLTYLSQAIKDVLVFAKNGQLIVLESTVAPGTTRSLLVEPLKEQERNIGKDIFVAFSPERVDPGNIKYNQLNTPRIIGGATDTCTQLTDALLDGVGVPVSSLEVAELSKLYENTFRFINIALANELQILSKKMGISFKEVVHAAGTKPFGFMPFYPTPGIGGHCIPVDPYYLVEYAEEVGINMTLVKTASMINDSMIDYITLEIMQILNNQNKSFSESSIGIIGATYKKDVADLRMAASHKIVDQLVTLKADVAVFDDLVVNHQIGSFNKYANPMSRFNASEYDLVIVLVRHTGTAISIPESIPVVDVTTGKDD